MIPTPLIVDLSEHQDPAKIDYDQLAQAIDLAIIRIQYGDLHEDHHYSIHIQELQQRGIPIQVYAWIRGFNEDNMRLEAENFYQRAVRFQPTMWWLDIEEQTMPDMVQGAEIFRMRLKELGALRVGAYIANHLYHSFGFTQAAIERYDALWLPAYGYNTGSYEGHDPTATEHYDLHQFTSNGHLPGFAGPLDLSRLARGNLTELIGLSFPNEPTEPPFQIGSLVHVSSIFTSSDSLIALPPLRHTARITKILPGARNPYLLDDGLLGWTNAYSLQLTTSKRYLIQLGDTLTAIAQKLGLDWRTIAAQNHLPNPDLIYPGQILIY